jgi:hypothetical protein
MATIKVLKTDTANQATQTKTQVSASSTPVAEKYKTGLYIPANELITNVGTTATLTNSANRWMLFPFTPEKTLRIGSINFTVSNQIATLNNIRLFLFKSNLTTGFPFGHIFVSDAIPTDSTTSANKVITTVNYKTSYSMPVTDIVLNKNERYWWGYYSTGTANRIVAWTTVSVNTLGTITTSNTNAVTCYRYVGALDLSRDGFSQANTTSQNLAIPRITIITTTV